MGLSVRVWNNDHGIRFQSQAWPNAQLRVLTEGTCCGARWQSFPHTWYEADARVQRLEECEAAMREPAAG
jgi:hypothetical protein